MMKKMLGLSFIVALSAVLAVVGPVAAAPLIQGESLLTASDGIAFIRVDWQVFSPGDASAPEGATAGLFQYVYQAEATVGNNFSGAPNDISAFTVTFLSTSLGFTTWQSVAGSLTIGSEINPATGNPLTCCFTPSAMLNNSLTTGNVQAQFSPVIARDGQSILLVGTSPFGPTGGPGTAVDGAPGSPWSSFNPNGQTVPIPVPEPATLILLGLATGLTGFVARKRK